MALIFEQFDKIEDMLATLVWNKASLSNRGTRDFFAFHDCLAIMVISSGDVAVSDEQVKFPMF